MSSLGDRSEAAELPRVPLSVPLVVGLIVSTALAVRAARGYRPFPSIDDFAYVPMAWAARDPALYPRDDLLHAFVMHAPVWEFAVSAAEHTVGLSNGFWITTLLLTVATVAAVYRLLVAAGASPLLLPLVALLVFCSRVLGIGRGAFDGALGDGFHVQWIAICLVLWTYDSVVRDRLRRAGVLLGLSTISHPAVALHGAFVIATATGVGGKQWWRNLLRTAGTCLLVSSPFLLHLLLSLLEQNTSAGWTAEELIVKGYIFRTPHHYVLQRTPPYATVFVALMAAGGSLGALLLRKRHDDGALRILAGLFAGHLLLTGVAVILHGPWLGGSWKYASVLPYMIDLTRTSPLLILLGAILLLRALGERLPEVPLASSVADQVLQIVLLLILVGALLAYADPHPTILFVVSLCAVGLVPVGRQRRAVFLGCGLVLAAGWGGAVVAQDVRTASLSSDEAALYRWVHRSTPSDAQFITPVGMEGFRFYARRGVHVDFKLLVPTTPSAVPEWRRRLEEVTGADRRTQAEIGWEGIPAWDHSYRVRNTPQRVARLLKETGADYLILDAKGLRPQRMGGETVRQPSAAVEQVFANQRFRVYRLANRTSTPTDPAPGTRP